MQSVNAIAYSSPIYQTIFVLLFFFVLAVKQWLQTSMYSIVSFCFNKNDMHSLIRYSDMYTFWHTFIMGAQAKRKKKISNDALNQSFRRCVRNFLKVLFTIINLNINKAGKFWKLHLYN